MSRVVRSFVIVAVFAAIGLQPAYSSNPARVFLPAGTFAIDWDIGFRIPPGWPPIPCSGGPGLRFSITDGIVVGLQVVIPSFFFGPFKLLFFSAYRIYDPQISFPGVAATLSLDILKSPYGPFSFEPSCGLAVSYGNETIACYTAFETTFLFADPSVFPLIEPDVCLGIVFSQCENLSLELALEGIGVYSSVSRSYWGRPAISAGMVNRF
jgi:hypothetical protein